MCLLLSQCKVNKTPEEELTLKDSICYVDTSHISSKLKNIITSYIHDYPQYDNLVLQHDNYTLKSKHKDLDIEELYILGPTFTGESYVKVFYPAFYFTINGKNVFINSSYDRFMNQEICESVYKKHLEKDMTSLNGVKFWLIRIDNTGSISVLTKNPDEYLGVDEVKETVTFTAPVSKRAIKADSNIFVDDEQPASFPGGQEALLAFLDQNVRYPDGYDGCGQGRVVVSFTIDVDGSIVDPKVIRSIDPPLDKEALRVVGLMPKWIPAKEKGKNKKSKFNLPILIKCQ